MGGSPKERPQGQLIRWQDILPHKVVTKKIVRRHLKQIHTYVASLVATLMYPGMKCEMSGVCSTRTTEEIHPLASNQQPKAGERDTMSSEQQDS
jgi:hypothetical protein